MKKHIPIGFATPVLFLTFAVSLLLRIEIDSYQQHINQGLINTVSMQRQSIETLTGTLRIMLKDQNKQLDMDSALINYIEKHP